jgi:hypothetical protein
MKPIYKLISLLLTTALFAACTKKAETVIKKSSSNTTIVPIASSEESITGIYQTQASLSNGGECGISVEITQTSNGYVYYLKTSSRKLKGKANFVTSESGEQYLVLEGIQWDDYEGDSSKEEESDSTSEFEPKELEIPVGIDASYVKDTLTIQNYGNSMNSYTKLSECGSKYIQLVKSQK